MLFIFGFHGFVKTLGMFTFVCRNCHNPSAHRLVQRSGWLTLFFIPLFPVSFSRYTVCTFCGDTVKVSKQEADDMLHAAQNPPDMAPQMQYGTPSDTSQLPSESQLPSDMPPPPYTPSDASGMQSTMPSDMPTGAMPPSYGTPPSPPRY